MPDFESLIVLAGLASIVYVLAGVVMFFYESAATIRARRRTFTKPPR